MAINKQLKKKNISSYFSPFDVLLQHAPDAIVICNSQGKIEYFNHGLLDLLAYSDHEIKALYLGHLDEFFGDSVNLQNECKLINEKGKQHRNSYLRAKTGESIPVTVCLSIQTYNGAEYLVMHARDITYEQEREVACVERKEKYQTFFETARDGAFVTSIEGKFEDCNTGMVELLGYASKEELLAKSVAEVYANPEERPQIIQKVIQEGYVNNHPLTGRKCDGTLINTLITLRALYNNKREVSGFCGTILNNNERFFAEKALHESYQMLETAEEMADMGSWQWVWKTNKMKLSNNALSIYGLKPEDNNAPIDEILSFFHSEDVDDFRLNMEKMLVEEKAGAFKYRIVRPDGEIRNIKGVGKLNFDNLGNITSIFGSIKDETNVVNNEKIIAARLRLFNYAEKHSLKELLQRILDEAEELTYSQNGFYHFIDEDQKTVSLQACSTNTWDLFRISKIENRYYPIQPSTDLGECLKQHKPLIRNDFQSLSSKLGLPEKPVAIGRELLVPVFQHSKIVAVLSVGNKSNDYNHQDKSVVSKLANLTWEIIERKKAQEKTVKLSIAVEQSPASTIITDEQGLIEYVNPKFSELTGYSLKESIGLLPNILNANIVDSVMYQDIWKTISAGNIWQGEFHNKKKNGDAYWENASIAPIKGENGDILNYIIVKEDITQKIKILTDLKVAKNKAEENDRLKSAFLNNMSHEIRTPLNGILGFTKLFLSPDSTPAQREDFSSIITQSSHQLLAIVSDILDIAKIETGQVKIKEEIVDLSLLCTEVYATQLTEATKKRISLEKEHSEICSEVSVLADKIILKKVLSYLLDNAIKFTLEGKVLLKCELRGDEILFSVSDTGIGIEKEKHESIFEHFRQAEVTNTRNYGGTGLGLSICRGLLKCMKGNIWLESEVNVGSTFYFTIPYKSAKGVEIKLEEVLTTVNNHTTTTILVAEDEQLNYLFLSEILQGEKYQVIHALNGKEAVDIIYANDKIDLVLMDIKMPVMNGYDATKEIKKRKPHIPIIAVTAFALEEEKEMAFEAGCDDYLSKPIDNTMLLRKLDSFLN